jgi:hypothetical protein
LSTFACNASNFHVTIRTLAITNSRARGFVDVCIVEFFVANEALVVVDTSAYAVGIGIAVVGCDGAVRDW